MPLKANTGVTSRIKIPEQEKTRNQINRQSQTVLSSTFSFLPNPRKKVKKIINLLSIANLERLELWNFFEHFVWPK